MWPHGMTDICMARRNERDFRGTGGWHAAIDRKDRDHEKRRGDFWRITARL